jgi:UDP-N-acetylmuramoyl-tripeptide--D-alanyl-D-alanine ligase
LPNGVRLVDDSYNASPSAVRAMLAALAATPVTGRRVAVLGEMLELGASSRALHESCGRAVADAGVDELVVIGGPAADGVVDGAVAGGLVRARVHRFADSASAVAEVPHFVRGGDLVLVKGSRGTRTDLVADGLKQVAG